MRNASFEASAPFVMTGARLGVVRGRRADAGIFAGLRGERVVVHPVDTRTGVRAGQLLGSDLAVDAFVVAVADLAGGAIVATSDLADIKRLAAYASHVAIADIDGARGRPRR